METIQRQGTKHGVDQRADLEDQNLVNLTEMPLCRQQEAEVTQMNVAGVRLERFNQRPAIRYPKGAGWVSRRGKKILNCPKASEIKKTFRLAS